MVNVGRRVWSALVAVVAFGVLALASWMYASFGVGALAVILSRSMVVHMSFDVFAFGEGFVGRKKFLLRYRGPDSSPNPPF